MAVLNIAFLLIALGEAHLPSDWHDTGLRVELSQGSMFGSDMIDHPLGRESPGWFCVDEGGQVLYDPRGLFVNLKTGEPGQVWALDSREASDSGQDENGVWSVDLHVGKLPAFDTNKGPICGIQEVDYARGSDLMLLLGQSAIGPYGRAFARSWQKAFDDCESCMKGASASYTFLSHIGWAPLLGLECLPGQPDLPDCEACLKPLRAYQHLLNVGGE